MLELARITGIAAKPLDPACGAPRAPAVAVIDEAACIGCTLCIQDCPVDAIVGASKLMHTVIAAECTGCGLCLPPCPVDCISMVETGEALAPEERRRRAVHYEQRYRARLERERARQLAAERATVRRRKKQTTIDRVMQRARERLERRSRSSEK